jgi:RNA polymerase sigma-70 factor, ECF subfamily
VDPATTNESRTDSQAARQDSNVVAIAVPRLAPAVACPGLPELYDVHFSYIYAILRRLGVWDRDLEDAVHDVFIVVHRRLPDYDPSRPVRPWLAGIATRVASEFRRRARHRREVVTEDAAMEREGVHQQLTPAADEQLADRERRALVAKGLDALDDDRRAVLVLHDVEGHSMPEVAAALDTNINTLYARLRTARQEFAVAVRAAQQARDGGGA